MSHLKTSKTNQIKSSNAEKKDKQINKENQPKNDETEESSSSDDDDEPIRAPIQLKIEFVNSIMFRQWELAQKLCQFMLIYEPNNSEAKQYAPLIDYMLEQEQAASSSSSDDDSSDDGDDDDDASGSTSSSSSSSSENEEETTDIDDAKAPKPVNASLSHKCHHK
ncbi:unnamed protein product [Adineta steineri]|uniref:Uncharacterized protein n=1 Tax=Adineta steineri TaxID=433720 RepID=A0A819BNM4_9BILA|nr:unnamed protein product [Adineta steineri]CAF1227768.1 unnamed protein product [Adineta steineri]CAF3706211.1 unnamed protein product [Adineta steineri]CAF3804716.1 unnamed protein product [Adineta steineri]